MLCEDVAMIGTQLHTLYATSLLFILAILHNTPYCITKIFNISKSYLYTSIPLYRGCVLYNFAHGKKNYVIQHVHTAQ